MGLFGDGLVEPEIWPPNSKEVERIVRRYQSEAQDRCAKHATGLREFFASGKKKIDVELAEVRKANLEAKYPVSEEFLKDLSEPPLRSLLSAVDDRLGQTKTRLATRRRREGSRWRHQVTGSYIAAEWTSMKAMQVSCKTGWLKLDCLSTFESLYQQDFSVGSIHEYLLPWSSSPPEYSTQFGHSRGDYSWCNTVNEVQIRA